MTSEEREQIRRDAERVNARTTADHTLDNGPDYQAAMRLAERAPALLDTLEQAERERDENMAALLKTTEQANGFAARLSAVPALVEAVEREHGRRLDPRVHCDICEALAAYHKAQEAGG